MRLKLHQIILALCVIGCLGACAWLRAPVSESTPKAIENPAGGFDVATPAGTLHIESKDPPDVSKPITGKLKDGTTYTWTPPPIEAPRTNWDAIVGIGSKVLGIVTGHPELAFALAAGGKIVGEVAGISGGAAAKKPEDEPESTPV